MNTPEFALNYSEKVIFKLRSLYSKCGYSPYRMSKFEEYDLYARNKDFLISDSIITFTDTNGKLMALKPDVTLSIIKNSKDNPSSVQKVYYNENVYRISKGTHSFKEIMQVGLECFGDVDIYNTSEVISLACKSLKAISDNSVLYISHLGILTSVFDAFDIPSYARQNILKLISEKNTHELNKICAEIDLDDSKTEIIKNIINTSGNKASVLPYLYNLLSDLDCKESIDELSQILNTLNDVDDMIKIDFSVVSDTHYYNTIVFKGFIEGIPSSVLSGGKYDKLMEKMKRKSKAIGFAVYLDMLERLDNIESDCDVDVVVIYGANTNPTTVSSTVSEIQKKGLSVLACKNIPDNLKFKEIVNLIEREVNTDEENA